MTSRPYLSLLIASTISTPVFAQEVTGDLPSVEVSASRFITPPHDRFAQTSVITAQRLANLKSLSLAEVLAQEAGIQLISYGNPMSAQSISIRGGSHAQTLVLIDGIRINNAYLGGASLHAIPVSSIERIEIIRGPISSLYGADAMSGVINIITHKKSAPGASLSASASRGSHQRNKAEVQLQAADTVWQFRLNALHDEARGYNSTKITSPVFTPDNDGFQQTAFNGSLNFTPSNTHALTTTFGSSTTRADYDNGVDSDDWGEQELRYLNLKHQWQVQDHWTSLMTLGYNEDTFLDVSGFGTSFVQGQHTEFAWQNDFTLNTDHKLSLGYSYLDERATNTAWLSGQQYSRYTNGLQASWLYTQAAHEIQISGRFDDNSQYSGETTGSIHYAYQLSPTWTTRLGVGSGFRAPSLNELFFPDYGVSTLKPEHSTQLEAGLTYKQTGHQLDISVFQQRVDDLIIYQAPCATPGYTFGCASNVQDAKIQGLSVEYRYRLPKSIRVNLHYDWLNPRDKKTDLRLARRAEHRLLTQIEKPWGNYTLGAEWLLSSHRYDDAANTVRMGGYSTTSIYGHYELAPDTTVSVRVDNIFDKAYELAYGYATTPRQFLLSIRHKL